MRDVTPGDAAQSKGFLSEKRQSGPTDDFEQQRRFRRAPATGRPPPDVPIAEQHFETAKERRPPSGALFCGGLRRRSRRVSWKPVATNLQARSDQIGDFGERFLQKVGLDIPHGNRPETHSCKMAGSIDLAG